MSAREKIHNLPDLSMAFHDTLLELCARERLARKVPQDFITTVDIAAKKASLEWEHERKRPKGCGHAQRVRRLASKSQLAACEKTPWMAL